MVKAVTVEAKKIFPCNFQVLLELLPLQILKFRLKISISFKAVAKIFLGGGG